MTTKFVAPIDVTDAVLTASNIAENDQPIWSAGTYNTGDKVMKTTGVHKIYEVVAVPSTTDDPEVGVLADPQTWIEISATNRWKMFDGIVGSQSENATSINIDLLPSEVVNSIALLNLSAATVDVTVTDPIDGVVYDETFNLTSYSGIDNWYDYYFTAIDREEDLVINDIPPYANATINIVINQPGGTAKVGVVATGKQFVIGDLLYGTGFGIIDYSRKETDAFGNSTIVKRAFSERSDFDIVIDTNRLDEVKKKLTAIRSTPVVWIGEDSFSASIIYGYYRDFSIVISNVSISNCSIEIEGLV